jgi:hypothetical protein
MEIFILSAVIVAAVATVDVKNPTQRKKGTND